MRALLFGCPLLCFLGLLGCSPAGAESKSYPHGSGQAGTGSAGDGATGGNGVIPAGGSTAEDGGRGGSAAAGGAASGGKAGGNGGSGPGSGDPCEGADIFCSDFEAGAIPGELIFYPEYLRAT